MIKDLKIADEDFDLAVEKYSTAIAVSCYKYQQAYML